MIKKNNNEIKKKNVRPKSKYNLGIKSINKMRTKMEDTLNDFHMISRFTKNKLDNYLFDYNSNLINLLSQKDCKITYEYINPNLLNFILNNEQKIKSVLETNDYINQNFNVLEVIKQCSINGFFRVLYKKSECGRVYSHKSVSLQSILRNLRHLLSYGLYHDIDIVNCFPTIFADFCEKNMIDCTNIIDYRDNREKHIKDLLKKNPTKSRDYIKETILSIFNGGTSNYNKLIKTPFLEQLFNESEKITEEIVKNNQQLYRKCVKYNITKNDNNKIFNSRTKNKRQILNESEIKIKSKRTTVSYILMHRENEILDYIIHYFKQNNIIKNNLYVSMFDGIQISNEHSPEIIKKHIKLLEKEIKKNLKIKLKLKIKGFDECDELLKLVPKNLLSNNMPYDELKKLIDNDKFNKNMFNHVFKYKTKIEPDVILNQKLLKSYSNFINDNSTVYVRSNMGTGKTKQLYQYLKEVNSEQYIYDKKSYKFVDVNNTTSNGNKKKILFVTFRKSLGKKYDNDLQKFEYYLNIKDKKINADQHPNVIIQINSLHRITGIYDIIVFDEISYTLDMFLNYCKQRVSVFDALKHILKTSDKVICLDAFLSNREVTFINNLRKDKKSCVILNNNKIKRGQIYNLQKTEFTEQIIDDLKKDKKITLSSNSKSYLEDKLVPLIENIGKKYKVITSETDDFVSCDDWDQYDIIMYTPTVIAGISFEKHHFNKRYGYFTNITSSANLCVQQLFRVRNTTDKNIYLCCSIVDQKYYPTSREDIDSLLHDYINIDNLYNLNNVVDDQMMNLDRSEVKYIVNDYYNLLVGYLENKHKSNNNIFSELSYYLNIQGYDICFDYNLPKVVNDTCFGEIIKDHIENKLGNEFDFYKNSNCLSIDEIEKIKLKERKNKQDKLILNKYKLEEQKIDISNIDCPKQMNKIIKNLANARFDFLVDRDKEIDENLDDFLKNKILLNSPNCKKPDNIDIINIQEVNETIPVNTENEMVNSHQQHNRDYWVKCYTSNCLLKELGLNISDKDVINKSFILDDKIRDNIYNFVHNKWAIYNQLFKVSDKYNYRSHYDKNSLSLINSTISVINCHITRKRVKVKNKLHYVYKLEPLINNNCNWK